MRSALLELLDYLKTLKVRRYNPMTTANFKGNTIVADKFVGEVSDAVATVSALIPTYTVATLPSAASNSGRSILVSDGDAGAATLATSDGSNWDVAIGANAGTPVAAA